MAIIAPKLCDRDAFGPQAAIEQVRVDGEVVLDRSGVGQAPQSCRREEWRRRSAELPLRRRSTGDTFLILLPPGSGGAPEFRFTAPVFTASEKAAFRYRLRGVDDRWIEAGTRREGCTSRGYVRARTCSR